MIDYILLYNIWFALVFIGLVGILMKCYWCYLKMEREKEDDSKYPLRIKHTKIMTDPQFKYKCTCLWSKDDKYGFISLANCPVHGKNVKKLLGTTVKY